MTQPIDTERPHEFVEGVIPRIWLEGTPSGRWLLWLDGQARGTEYRPIAPIQAALKKCEDDDGAPDPNYVVIYKPNWDAVVALIKGESRSK